MHAYRLRHDVPRNEVSDLLHMSAECLCGAFAKPGEIELLQEWFPDTAARIHALEGAVRAAGITACIWGQRPPGRRGCKADPGALPPQRLCFSCTITDEQHQAMIADPAYTRKAA